MRDGQHRGWYSRGYLPHFDQPGLLQSVTFRLADSLQAEILEGWRGEIAALADRERARELYRRVEHWLDAGHGQCWLRDPRIATLVEEALLHFDGQRYRMLAWVVMPNHIHVPLETMDGWPLGDVVYSWKSWTAKEANKVLQRSGQMWARECFDRYIRDGDHYADVLRYIEENPVKAGLCARAEDWRWSSARCRRELPRSAGDAIM
jgi:putative DNA methylase